MENLNLIIAKNISQIRKDNKLTQIELAEKLNYSDKAISKWERGESLPDIAVLKEFADMFGVTLDYLVEQEHKKMPESIHFLKNKIHNRGFITGISILLVWLIATIIFVITDITIGNVRLNWLAFVYAAPVSIIVWLVLNSIWFDKHRNFLIISILMWTVIAAVFFSFLAFSINIWKIFLLGAPGQIIIYMWSKLKYKSN